MSELPEDSIPDSAVGDRPVVVRWLVAFGKFWWEFLVGDTPELFVGSVASVGAVAMLTHGHTGRALTVAALPVLAVSMLTITVYRGRKHN